MLSGFELLNFFGLLLWLRSTSMAMHMLSSSCISFIPKQGHKTGQSSSTVRSKALPLWTSAETEAPGLEICSWFSGSSESAGWLGGWSLEWRGIKLNIAVGVGDKMEPELGLTRPWYLKLLWTKHSVYCNIVNINVCDHLLDYVLRSLQVGRSQKFDSTDEKALIKQDERKQSLFVCEVGVQTEHATSRQGPSKDCGHRWENDVTPKHYSGNL